MNRKRVLLIIFLAAVAAQILVPLWMIWRREDTLKNGDVFKFKTAPVDPYDAFRGRYVALRTASRTAPIEKGLTLPARSRVYASIGTDLEGYAYFKWADTERPANGSYVRTRTNGRSSGMATLQVPFDRFYMEEGEAPEAERAHSRSTARTNRTAHIQVRVKNGFAVIENLYIENQPIREYLKGTHQSGSR
ncbi:MAG: GDYXXLXY domain-containing protein [Verrucomicrobia bacterium]|nr:GDYXXLXY domain-containing protein [Verrucomicrobiota bacterium]